MRAAALKGKVDEKRGAVAFRGGFLGGRHTLTLTERGGTGRLRPSGLDCHPVEIAAK